MKKLLIFVAILLILASFVFGYLGLVPGLSDVMATNKPKDLGVEFSQQDLELAQQQTQVETEILTNESANSSGSAIANNLFYEGSHEANLELTSEQITALANNSNWKYNPLSNVQVRLNQDGSAEASGYIDFEAAKQYAITMGVSATDIEAALNKFPIPQSKFAFYVKLNSGSVSNNQIQMDVAAVKLANIPVPGSIISTYAGPAANFIENRYLNNDSIKVESLQSVAGKAVFKGMLPNKEVVKE